MAHPTNSDEAPRPDPVEHDREHEDELEHAHALNWLEIGRVVFVAMAAAVFWFWGRGSSPYILAIGATCTIVGGFPIFAEAYENITQRRMTMELSMAIAIVAALAIREIFTALIITLFVLIAEILEGLTVGRGRRAIQRLVDMLPNTATVRTPAGWSDVGIEQVRAGDVVLVRPGGRIPVDGAVVGGHSFVDQAAITGESLAVEKMSGATVYAGTINQSGALEVRVDRLGRDTTFGKIIEEVERAEKSRAPIQKTADRLAGYLVYFALGAAALTFLITHNVRSTISVVIVAGACGIAAGTPLAILGGIGQAARRGVIIKGGIHLESLARIDTVLLDKTGTLSYGTLELLEICPVTGASERTLLEAAAIAESRSEHPVAKAILKKSRERGFICGESGGFDSKPGKGVIAEHAGEAIVVGTKLFLEEEGVDLSEWNANGSSGEVGVSRGGRFLGTLRVGDTLRPESRGAVSALKGMGLKTILLTGDARAIADGVGAALGVDQVAAELLPTQKLEYVQELVAQGHSVAMVGDGINDAPALMKASVGVAMGSGTDVARESANILLIGNDLSKFVETVTIARQCRRIILQNFTGTLVVDGIGIGLAATGILNPLLAAFIHVSSELTFILNSARLLPSSGTIGEAMKSDSAGPHLETVTLASQLGK
jgi:Cd2+/Zn2+-exporting ATPase/Cu+-exporting ATPase